MGPTSSFGVAIVMSARYPMSRAANRGVPVYGARPAGTQTNRAPDDEGEKEIRMSTVERSIEVEVPVRTAYNQWTQFEEFPQFMEGVESVRQSDDRHLHWIADIGGVRREWDAEITEQHPDERVAWRATSGTRNAGVVTFHRLDAARTKIMLQLEVDPDGFVEQAGDRLGFVSRRAASDLERFKEYIEARGRETGAWRGDIPPKS